MTIQFQTLELQITCPFCSAEHSVKVAESDFCSWQSGALAQEVFPYLDSTQREQLISHMCPECQADFFGEEEEVINPEDDFEWDDECKGCDRCSAEECGKCFEAQEEAI